LLVRDLLLSSGRCLQSHYLVTGLHATIFSKINSEIEQDRLKKSNHNSKNRHIFGLSYKCDRIKGVEKRVAYSRMGVTRNEYKIVVGNLRDIDLFGELRTDGRILLKRILK
jgi:hypothetical protein